MVQNFPELREWGEFIGFLHSSKRTGQSGDLRMAEHSKVSVKSSNDASALPFWTVNGILSTAAGALEV